MSMLTRAEILKEIKDGRVRIENVDDKDVNTASVDLLLDTTYYEFKKLERPLTLDDYTDERDALDEQKGGNSIELTPGKTIVCQTSQSITLPPDIAGLIMPRGKTVLRGLNLVVSTGFVKPGIWDKKRLFFLVSNLGPNRVQLKTGDKLCQLVLFRL